MYTHPHQQQTQSRGSRKIPLANVVDGVTHPLQREWCTTVTDTPQQLSSGLGKPAHKAAHTTPMAASAPALPYSPQSGTDTRMQLNGGVPCHVVTGSGCNPKTGDTVPCGDTCNHRDQTVASMQRKQLPVCVRPLLQLSTPLAACRLTVVTSQLAATHMHNCDQLTSTD